MARGRHARRKNARDAHQQQELAAQLSAEVDQERARVQEALARERATQELRETIWQVQTATTEELAAYVERLTRELSIARERASAVSGAHDIAMKGWRRVSSLFVERSPGTGTEQVEALLRVVGRGGYLVDDGIERAALSAEASVRLQTARGQRGRGTARDFLTGDGTDAVTAFEGVLRPALTTHEQLRERAMAALGSAPMSRHHDAVPLWWPTMATRWEPRDPYGWLPAGLGVDGADDAPVRERDQVAVARLLAGDLARAEAGDAALARGQERLARPWSPRPRFSRPGDAVLLRNHYALSALGAWMRHAEWPGTHGSDPGDETSWVRGDLTRIGGRLAATAVAAREAVPFWLPPGQTHAYADSHAPSGADLDLLRLPFEHVMLTFADPLRVGEGQRGAGSGRVAETIAQLGGVDELTAERALFELAGDQTHGDPRPELAEVFTRFGAMAEGVLFHADPDTGEVRDEFAWLLALDAGPGARVFARVAVPASRAHADDAVAAMLTNLLAVPAWGDWHEPPEAGDRGRGPGDGQAQERPGVRVLNVTRTNSSGSAATAGPGRRVAPHVRRGHWRRQRYGAGRASVRMVRVAPVLVNASRFADVGARVYRVPVHHNDLREGEEAGG